MDKELKRALSNLQNGYSLTLEDTAKLLDYLLRLPRCYCSSVSEQPRDLSETTPSGFERRRYLGLRRQELESLTPRRPLQSSGTDQVALPHGKWQKATPRKMREILFGVRSK